MILLCSYRWYKNGKWFKTKHYLNENGKDIYIDELE